jgi:hypothetical protein
MQYLRTWRQQEMTIAFLWLLLQKRIPLPSSCVRTFVDFLIHDNTELRKVCSVNYFRNSLIILIHLDC